MGEFMKCFGLVDILVVVIMFIDLDVIKLYFFGFVEVFEVYLDIWWV